MARILAELSPRYVARAGLKITGVLFGVYLVCVLSHALAGFGMISWFIDQVPAAQAQATAANMPLFLSPEILAQYGTTQQWAAGMLLALVLGTAFFFLIAPILAVLYGFTPAKQTWKLSPLLSILWLALSYTPELSWVVSVGLLLPAPVAFGFGAWAYHQFIYLPENTDEHTYTQ